MLTNKLLNKFQKLTDENQQQVLDFVEFLINKQDKELNSISEKIHLEPLDPDQKKEKEIVWEEVLKIMEREVIRPIFDSWIKDSCIPLSLSETIFVIGTKDTFIKDWLEARYSNAIKRVVRGVIDRNIEVEFEVIEQHIRLAGR